MKKMLMVIVALLFFAMPCMAADEEITDFTELTVTPAAGDLLVIVDVSDTTDSAEGTTKKITANTFKLHTVIVAGKPAIFGGDTIATLGTVAISNANPSVLTKDATIDDGLAVGDLVIVNSGTNATVGEYWVASIVADTSVTLDRQAATGVCNDGNVTYVNDPIVIETSSGSGEPRIVLPLQNDATTPTLAFGDGTWGLYSSAVNTLRIGFGAPWWEITPIYLGSVGGDYPGLLNEVASATNPTLAPARNDPNTGIGWAAADQLSLIAGGVEGIRLTENTGVILSQQVNTGLSAVNPGGQGDGVLTSSVNVVATVGTAADAVTMPSAASGMRVIVINNGANSLEIWPSSGDNLGSGVDTAINLAAGSNAEYIAIDVTNWETL